MYDREFLRSCLASTSQSFLALLTVGDVYIIKVKRETISARQFGWEPCKADEQKAYAAGTQFMSANGVFMLLKSGFQRKAKI